MSRLKTLASDTAIYGISSILGRLINYLLVPLHTTVFVGDEMGVVTILYSYTAILMVTFTFGMETAFFRFSKSDEKNVYRLTSTVVISIATVFSVLIFTLSNQLADIIGLPEAGLYVRWLAIIIWIDAVLAIPFAKLRYENKAKKFAIAKMVGILVNILLQTAFLLALPKISPGSVPELGVGYIFLANLIGNALIIPILFKEVLHIRMRFNWTEIKPILAYSFPIFLMGLAGMFNEQIDKILIEHWLPDTFYDFMDGKSATGVYGQTIKLAIFMMLAIQAFRYAGEPFFFSKAEDRNAPELFAKVMHYFIIAGLLIFVLVSINVNAIAQVFLRSEEYRTVLYLVPFLLFGKLLYGVYINLSIWFKLTDKTIFGTYFSLVGVVLIVVSNILFIPILGLLGCALSIIICYVGMCILCYIYGQRHFPIPYNFIRLLPYFVISVLLVGTFSYLEFGTLWTDLAVRIILSLLIVAGLFLFEKRNWAKWN